ncbi:hypothetical protein H650_20440 [Enterobacter sp. R4-368]|nr:hypothetical protein H650_20440 [Enterobacter sp. R4-368]
MPDKRYAYPAALVPLVMMLLAAAIFLPEAGWFAPVSMTQPRIH